MAEQNSTQLDNPNHVTQTTVQKPAVFTIGLELEGFPVTVQVEGKAESLTAMVKRLKELGATPPAAKIIEAPAPVAATNSAGSKPPKCPNHSRNLKESRKPGEFFCPAKDEDTDSGYCEFKWKAGK